MRFRNPLSDIVHHFSPSNIKFMLYYWWDCISSFAKFSVILLVTVIVIAGSVSYSLAAKHQEIRDVQCLAMNLYHEARGEPKDGKYAVARVTLNRVKSSKYPNDVCDVVFQSTWNNKIKKHVAAFSWTRDHISDAPKEFTAWSEALAVAKEAYHNPVGGKVEDALFYHADYVNPYWAKKKQKVAKIGHHIFYR